MKVVLIISLVLFIIAIFVNILAFVLEKKYKSKLTNIDKGVED